MHIFNRGTRFMSIQFTCMWQRGISHWGALPTEGACIYIYIYICICAHACVCVCG